MKLTLHKKKVLLLEKWKILSGYVNLSITTCLISLCSREVCEALLFFFCHPFQTQNPLLFSSQTCTSSSGTLAEKILPAFHPKPCRNQFESHRPGYVQNVDETITCGFTLQCFAKIKDLELSNSPPFSERKYSAMVGFANAHMPKEQGSQQEQKVQSEFARLYQITVPQTLLTALGYMQCLMSGRNTPCASKAPCQARHVLYWSSLETRPRFPKLPSFSIIW